MSGINVRGVSSMNEMTAQAATYEHNQAYRTNPNSSKVFHAPGKENIVSFIMRLANNTGERMTDSKEMHLPFHEKSEVYEHFKEDLKRANNAACKNLPTQTYFLRIWKAHCRHIKARKTSRFSKCDI